MPLELTLIQWEKFSEIISLCGAYLFLKAIDRGEQVVYYRDRKKKAPPGPNASQLTATAIWLLLLNRAILTEIAFIRLNNIKKQNQQSAQKTPIEPSINITSGFPLVVVGTLLVAIGAQERADLGQPVTIV